MTCYCAFTHVLGWLAVSSAAIFCSRHHCCHAGLLPGRVGSDTATERDLAVGPGIITACHIRLRLRFIFASTDDASANFLISQEVAKQLTNRGISCR